jgi:hypothetical protein
MDFKLHRFYLHAPVPITMHMGSWLGLGLGFNTVGTCVYIKSQTEVPRDWDGSTMYHCTIVPCTMGACGPNYV